MQLSHIPSQLGIFESMKHPQVSPRTGKRVDAETKKTTQVTRKVPRLGEKGCPFCFFFGIKARPKTPVTLFFGGKLQWSSKPNLYFLGKKKHGQLFETREQNKRKGRQSCWTMLDQDLNQCSFAKGDSLVEPPGGSTLSLRWMWPLNNLRFLIVYIRIMRRECGSWRPIIMPGGGWLVRLGVIFNGTHFWGESKNTNLWQFWGISRHN